MAQYFVINAENPQARLIKQAVEILQSGGVIVYPTDSSYALGCALGHKEAQDIIRRVRGVDESHLFTLMCRNLSELSIYAKVDNAQFRLLKANTPGPYTFILDASREVPRRLQHAKRSTIGLRVPQHKVVQAILEVLDAPLLSMTLQLPEDELPMNIAWEIRERLEHQVDLVIDSDVPQLGETTIVDLSGESPEIIRQGIGNIEMLGI
jgi:tRNA threonylcarbamoyl adenosine modification protein (Sua5/YciO/YrdC/YwlC family)